MKTSRLLVCLCLILLMGACAHQAPRWTLIKPENGMGGSGRIEYTAGSGTAKRIVANGIGGSGRTLDRNGIGGSGRQMDTPENGIGGSGQSAILGEIRAFGSIWVNDKHILLPEQTRFLKGEHRAGRSDLKLGQIVAVLADVLDDEYLAKEVHLLNNVVGPIQKIEGALQILGQQVHLKPRAKILDQQGEAIMPAQLQPGQWVSVSGLRAPDGTIQASLIQRQAPSEMILAGPVTELPEGLYLGGQALRFQDDVPDLSEPMRLSGTMQEDAFVIHDWTPLPHTRFFALADEIWLEGFPTDHADLFIDGFEVQLPDMAPPHLDDIMRIGIDMEDQQIWMQPEEAFDEYEPMDPMDWRREDSDHHEHAPEGTFEPEPIWDDEPVWSDEEWERPPEHEAFEPHWYPEEHWEPYIEEEEIWIEPEYDRPIEGEPEPYHDPYY